jgi:hypothetical protein
MERYFTHKLISHDGKYIVLPAYKGGQEVYKNLTIPNPYSESTSQLYPIGTRFYDDDRVWRYAKAGNTCTRLRVLSSYNAYSSTTVREYAVLAAAAAVGDTTLTLTAQGTVTADMFAGGYAVIQSTIKQLYRIVSNTAAAIGSTFTVTLDNPVRTVLAVTNYAGLYRDTYSDVRYLTGPTEQGWSSFVGVPHYTITSGSFAWIQTWGPCLVACSDAVGADINERDLVINIDGAVNITQDVSTGGFQHFGYVLAYTGPGPTGVDMPGANVYAMCQLAP